MNNKDMFIDDIKILDKILAENNGAIIAERHDQNTSPVLLIKAMPVLKARGVGCIALECFNASQPEFIKALNEYQSTPQNTKIKPGYNNVLCGFIADNSHLSWESENKKAQRELTTDELRSIVFKGAQISSLHTLIETAHQYGIKIVPAVNHQRTYQGYNSAKEMQQFNKDAKQLTDKYTENGKTKFVLCAGLEHTCGDYPLKNTLKVPVILAVERTSNAVLKDKEFIFSPIDDFIKEMQRSNPSFSLQMIPSPMLLEFNKQNKTYKPDYIINYSKSELAKTPEQLLCMSKEFQQEKHNIAIKRLPDIDKPRPTFAEEVAKIGRMLR